MLFYSLQKARNDFADAKQATEKICRNLHMHNEGNFRIFYHTSYT